MKHFATPEFWRCYHALPAQTRELADRCFGLLKADSTHPSLHFKRIGHYWSARVGSNYRAVAVESREGLIWFWIGRHAEYDRLLKS